MPTLYHWEPNAGSLEVLAALHEKNIPFESRYVDFLAGEMWRKLSSQEMAFAAEMEVVSNLEIEGPVLATESGAALTDSYFINLYLDDAFAQTPLRPADAESQWRINVWARWIGEELYPATNTLGCAKYATAKLKDKAIETLPGQERQDAWRTAQRGYAIDEIAEARRKIAVMLRRTEDALAKGAYLVGESVSLADFTLLGASLSLPKTAPDQFEGAPYTNAWLARMRERPSVQAALRYARSNAPDESFAPGAERSRWG
ncbi:MAG: glutathione S-transferase family protein [Hyphomonadaceae bacterium]|nr:glutathione S-transferase family protein [Hyphomonadaceae bacterium]